MLRQGTRVLSHLDDTGQEEALSNRLGWRLKPRLWATPPNLPAQVPHHPMQSSIAPDGEESLGERLATKDRA
jgi:hypothetical protein